MVPNLFASTRISERKNLDSGDNFGRQFRETLEIVKDAATKAGKLRQTRHIQIMAGNNASRQAADFMAGK